jgi:uncharacterized protein (DUF2267 family)
MESKTFADLVSQLRELAPFADDAAATLALSAVLSQLGPRLLEDERRAVAARLPAEATRLLRGAGASSSDDDQLVDAVAAAEHVAPTRAIEHLQIVVQAIAPLLDEVAQTHLARAVPELSWLLEPKAAVPPPLDAAVHAGRHTLSEGRPGSEHPLASAHPDQAQRHSVARSDDPHGDTKLSGAR